MSEILLEKVCKSYDETEVIHGVDWHIRDGEFVVIVGPSGCGKSTLLRMIAGLESVTGGNISIGDRIVNDLEPAQRDIAMVFQNYALYPHMSVFNNMAYGLKIAGHPKDVIEQRVNKAAEILEIGDYLNRSPRQLSGGQRQRVAMGRAIVREPSVFLFDEPLSNLDAKLRVQMRLEIKKLQERLGITSVYVTHDQVEAMTLGHRLMVLNGGNVEQLGTPIELYEHPATKFVAGFIGSPSMNFLDGMISADGKNAEFPGGGSHELVHAFHNHAGKQVTFGMRPEHLIVDDSGNHTMSYTVQVVEHLGADTLVHGTFGNDSSDLIVRLEGVRSVDPGEVLPLMIDPKNIHVFDSDNDRRVE
ncbi:MAG: sn-glycerol-3-phosphate import ATP-binding protein UgpC [Rhodospirillaceae bacterium]|jgi:sn-glycerol 3-phosphate transport system ATP-binding protein|nr:sn-glycerol-3-phosphate import ATP-binding protein UgpC [Rhodospirillaceae bacterium]MBT5245244.1 sn-glycerol-3-phosphate import ATP-binding protein UgpC [Rhodospirillaceae bacterium]MBT5562775.1 sn-glycerol-3-phosphate import ATP-binding protein UgpC [Rhodospirillaceae bacterium]MBT6240704.1 sn-glycerol-3-phosphate import ATP-binding protein UgpC [Rhodospirillaceae bacterium]